MTRIPGTLHAAAATAALAVAVTCYAAASPNTTGLPTYPHLNPKGFIMDETYRSIPNGQHCMHFNGSSADALADVEAWYRKQMPGAKIGDVNEDSIYGSYFKLEGIKLVSGNDIVNVMRMPNDSATYVDLFKCKDAPHP
jgi:hypothetical protein